MRRFSSLIEFNAATAQDLGVSEVHAISQKQIQMFAEIGGDHQWIHTDTKRAAHESPYGGTICQGYLILSLLPAMMREAFQVSGIKMIVNYGLDRVRFPAPVAAGASVQSHFRLLEAKQATPGLRTKILATMTVEGSTEPVCVAELVHLWIEDGAS